MQTANEVIRDALTGHAVGLQRLSNGTVRKIIALLNRSDARIIERLLTAEGLSRTRQEELLTDIRRILSSAYTDATGQLQIELEALAEYEGEFQGNLLTRAIPVQWNVIRPASPMIIAAVNARPFQGRLMREWYQDLEASAAKRMRDTIRAGLVEGRTVDQIIREIRGTKAQGYKDGIFEISRRNAAATVRTAINHTATVARAVVHEANSDIIKGEQWVSTLDGRTTLICMGRDGTVYPVGKGPRPPAHVNCRSLTIPVLKSWREMGINLEDAPPGTRASMNGQVASGETYDTWLRKQPVEFQNETLGIGKARLFREGGLTLDRFTDKAGNEYTLDELKAREAAAWQKAN